MAMLGRSPKNGVVQTDDHEGWGFPVGGVVDTGLEEVTISPRGVGHDINSSAARPVLFVADYCCITVAIAAHRLLSTRVRVRN